MSLNHCKPSDSDSLIYPPVMQTNDRLQLAHDVITKTGTSLFLTGKAGTGKTTFLRNLRETCRKRMIVTAPTGIAAINAGGMTLHSFFQLDFGPFIPGVKRDGGAHRRSMSFSKEKIRIIRGLDLLVIDEVSMVRADMLDAVDDVLRRHRDRNLPFGGVQLLLIGDLQQLPPVVKNDERHLLETHYNSPYFFDSHALSQLDYVTVELTEVYRQSDREFINLLNSVRDNRIDDQTLRTLNSRYVPGFNPADSEGYVRLTTHNRLANEINSQRMAALPTESHFFEAQIEGTFPETSYPADASLELKEGAQVMFIKNDVGADRRYFNGMLGRVTAIDENGVVVTAADSGDQIEVEPVEWENLRFVVDEETKQITEQRDGAFRQLPLRPAWAITIHKSQGLTFDRAIIDATLAFTHGQTYVALSRCRRLEGLVLERPVPASAIITDPLVTGYMATHRDNIDDTGIERLSHAYRLSLIEGMFNFQNLFNALEGIVRLLKENFMRLYQQQVLTFSNYVEEKRRSIADVGTRFCYQIRQIDAEYPGEEGVRRINERIKDACNYFYKQLCELHDAVQGIPTDSDNKKVVQKMHDRLGLYNDMEAIRLILLQAFSEEDFSTEVYLDIKARGAFRSTGNAKSAHKKEAKIQSEMSAANPNPRLFDSLREWRLAKSQAMNVPAFTIAPTKVLLAVATDLPLSHEELLMIPGVGPATAHRIGPEMLEIVKEYIDSEQIDIAGIKAAQAMTPRKPKKKKLKKGESEQTSLDMWNEGLTIEDIAQKRGLAFSTIWSHVTRNVDIEDEAVRRRLVPEESEIALMAYYQSHPEVPDNMAERIREIEEYTGTIVKYNEAYLIGRLFPDMIKVPAPEENKDQ